ncbi:MAG: ABC transporter ATP-binding protein [Fimbriimonadaceae bacterium]|nr:ABC transporter ATP-binding protein [Fimbriimonadaceae bacterium]QYK55797.1 MAG: ABC transporter ATP-binding protein [Fimbriimonadaceae bacterium]
MLEIHNLNKRYGNLQAVSDVSFSLQPGDIFGFIGSNGAGKTTTIRMIATLLEPDSGTARLNGIDIRRDPMAVRKMIGYMPDFFGLYDDVKVWEYLDFFANLYRVPAADRPSVIDNVLELTDLGHKKDAFASTLSRGMQQRLSLARCLVHDPSLLLLDEPASGLDPRARAELKELIAELGKMGKMVIVSSHILPELADFCNSVGIIEKGKLVTWGAVENVVRSVQAHKILEVRFLDKASEASLFLHGRNHVTGTHLMGSTTVKIEFAGDGTDQADLLQSLVNAGYRVTDFREVSADLEDVFLTVTTGAVQ